MADMPKAEGAKGLGRNQYEVRVFREPAPPTFASLGIDKNLAHRARKKSKLSEEAFEAHVERATKRAAKAVKRDAVAEAGDARIRRAP
jgi:hypothetical protein